MPEGMKEGCQEEGQVDAAVADDGAGERDQGPDEEQACQGKQQAAEGKGGKGGKGRKGRYGGYGRGSGG